MNNVTPIITFNTANPIFIDLYFNFLSFYYVAAMRKKTPGNMKSMLLVLTIAIHGINWFINGIVHAPNT